MRWVVRYREAAVAARLGHLFELSDQRGPETALVRSVLQRRPSHRVYLAQRRPGGRLVSRWNLIAPSHLAPDSA